jgi:streptogramin lyase
VGTNGRVRRWRLRLGAVGLVLAAGAAGAAPAASARPSAVPRATPPTVKYFFIHTGSANPRTITPGPDGNLWFTEADGNHIGRVSPAGVITEFPIGKSKNPYGIVAGADGNLWFTERNGNKIAAMTTAGALIHEYAVPSSDAGPNDITAGPDGNLWFTEGNSNADAPDNIGRVTPGGDMTEFPLSTCVCFPIGITTGPDGNIWVSEELGATPEMNGGSDGTVDRVSPDAKQIDRFAVSTTEMTLPGEVAPGPDGNVWFGELSGDRHTIGRVTPAGGITEHQIPATNSGISTITTGIDGSIWLAKGDENRIVIVRPNFGFVQDFGVHSTPLSLIIGPDGNMWFVASQFNEVGRIHTAKPRHGYVLDIAPGFAPAVRTVRMGTLVDWILEAPGMHSVRDATGMAMFTSGPQPPVSFFERRFTAAGAYRVRDGFSGPSGVLQVPVDVPAYGTTGHGVSLTWATVPAATGFVYDVQVRRPGATHWSPFRTGATARAGTFVPHDTGRFAFRARLRKLAGGQSDWSPPRPVLVHAA